ncbi:GL16780 [Drosophila persimilis]|uniref:GL16780 n=1 Tax=Drosophila persimilis TaxID=7234 RepID=B4GIC7_DROPE|nr:GL16780 [Drosophila persimilis]
MQHHHHHHQQQQQHQSHLHQSCPDLDMQQHQLQLGLQQHRQDYASGPLGGGVGGAVHHTIS